MDASAWSRRPVGEASDSWAYIQRRLKGVIAPQATLIWCCPEFNNRSRSLLSSVKVSALKPNCPFAPAAGIKIQ
jgi:hypothetical protein